MQTIPDYLETSAQAPRLIPEDDDPLFPESTSSSGPLPVSLRIHGPVNDRPPIPQTNFRVFRVFRGRLLLPSSLRGRPLRSTQLDPTPCKPFPEARCHLDT